MDIAFQQQVHGAKRQKPRRITIMRCAAEPGLSGKPVFEKSTAVQKKLAIALAGELPIIGVGGILGGEDAAEKIRAGASLVQFYSGFIYRGPDLVSEVADTLASIMKKSV